MLNKRYLFAVFLILFPLYLTWTFDHSLWNPDETRDAGIAREMYVEGDFVVPKLNGEAFLEKPPLYYWTCAACYKLTGQITAGTTRLPAALYGFLGILFTFLIGRRLFNARVGFIAAAILGTSVQYFKTSHFALMDSALAALITAAFYFYLSRRFLLFILFTILAFYAKGFVAIALIGLVVGADLLMERRLKSLARITVGGAALFIVLVAPWVYGLWKSGGQEFLKIFFVDNNFLRYAGNLADHKEPFFFYLGSFPLDFLPWTFIFVGAFYDLFIKEWRRMFSPERRFVGLWFLLMFIFLSLSNSKRSMYFMPLFPSAALLCAIWFEKIILEINLKTFARGIIYTTFGFVMLIAASLFAYDAIAHKKIFYILAVLPIIGGITLYFWKNLHQHCYGKVFLSLFFIMAFFLASADILLVKDLEQRKSFLPFIDMVKREQGFNHANLIGYDFDEMERGVFSFYFEGPIKNFTSGSELDAYLKTHKTQKILLISRRSERDEITKELGKMVKIVHAFQEDKKTHSYLLYRN